MGNAVFIQNPDSIYDDQPGVAYHFPKSYLKAVEACVGDWVIFYEGKKGVLGYVAVQRVNHVTPDPRKPDHYYAWLDPQTLWQFETVVPRNAPDGKAYEQRLRGKDGKAMSGGFAVSAVRAISFEEFVRIVSAGLAQQIGPNSLPRDEVSYHTRGFDDQADAFDPAPLADIRDTLLVSRQARDDSFARQVKAAYGGCCAISGLDLRNGGGRAEVQAAHIRPVKHDGPDIVINGLALSGTVHWMFDRGLISIADDLTILVSENKVSPDVRQRLIAPSGKLQLPHNPRHHPHPDYLRFHRENIYGAAS